MIHDSDLFVDFIFFESNSTDQIIVPCVVIPLTGIVGVVILSDDRDVLLDHSDASTARMVFHRQRLLSWSIGQFTTME